MSAGQRPTIGTTGPEDPLPRVAAAVAAFQQQFNADMTMQQQASTLYNQMNRVMSDQNRTPAQRDATRNQYARQIQDVHRRMVDRISAFEDQLSLSLGRRVTLEEFAGRVGSSGEQPQEQQGAPQ